VELWLHEPPVDGAANAAVVEDIARWLGIPRRLVHLISGATARTKIIEIEGPVSLPPPDAPPPPDTRPEPTLTAGRTPDRIGASTQTAARPGRP
jgi:hypothetical protein